MNYLIVVNDLDKKRIIKEMSVKPDFFSYKVIGIKEFKKKLFFEYTDKSILYLVEKYQLSKDIAEIYLENLYYLIGFEEEVVNEKIIFLQKLYQELLEKKLLVTNPLWIDNLKKEKIIFYHIKLNKFINYIIHKCKALTEVEIIKHQPLEKSNIEIKEYPTIENEVVGIMNEICQKIKSGIPVSNIYLTNLSQDYRKLFQLYGKIFHIPFTLYEKENLYSSILVKEFITEYQNSGEEAIYKLKQKYKKSKEQEVINKIIEVMNRYAFIKETRRKKIFIIDDLKKLTIKKEQNINSIHEIDFFENEIPSNSVLFLVGMVEGNFPKIYKDEKYLSEKENKLLGWDTIVEQNELEKEYCIQKLQTFPNLFLSYPRKNGKMDLYPSRLIETLNLKVQKNEAEIYHHSHLFNQLELSKKLDSYQKYGKKPSNLSSLLCMYPQIPYRKYNNAYQLFSSQPSKVKTVSYSAIDVFFHCAFRYYLQYVLRLNVYEETFYQKIGTLFHDIIKESYDSNFIFDISWNQNISKILIKNAKERFFLSKLKQDLKRVLNILKIQENDQNFTVVREKQVSLEIENMNLVGIIDKIFMKKKDGKTLISIVDYKTGTPNLNLDHAIYGLNLQLPIYLLLIQSLSIENPQIIGFYFQKILPTLPISDSIHTEEELKKQQLKLQGYSIDEEDILKEFDANYENSKYIAGLKKSSKGFYAYSKIWNEKQFQKIKQITLEKLKSAINEISLNNFQINPKRIGNKLIGCEHCNYQDICFYKEKDVQNLKEQKVAEFLGGNKNANMDERTK